MLIFMFYQIAAVGEIEVLKSREIVEHSQDFVKDKVLWLNQKLAGFSFLFSAKYDT